MRGSGKRRRYAGLWQPYSQIRSCVAGIPFDVFSRADVGVRFCFYWFGQDKLTDEELKELYNYVRFAFIKPERDEMIRKAEAR